MRPQKGKMLLGPFGNNAFAYEQRKRIDPEPRLRLPGLKTISRIDDIELGTLPTFVELDDNENINTYTGLKYIYSMDVLSPVCMNTFSCGPSSIQDVKNGDVKNFIPTTVPIYIFDNHNYALYFWAKYIINDAYNASLPVIHIDQHSDMGTPPKWLSGIINGKNGDVLPIDVNNYVPTELDNIAHYTTHICNVGNFIRPALDAGIISDCVRIKNQYDLEKNGRSHLPLHEKNYILDIDLDFRAPEMGTNLTKSIPLVQSLMRDASLITIATSPYFLEQPYALHLLNELFR